MIATRKAGTIGGVASDCFECRDDCVDGHEIFRSRLAAWLWGSFSIGCGFFFLSFFFVVVQQDLRIIDDWEDVCESEGIGNRCGFILSD